MKEAIEIKQIPQDQLLNENMGKHNIQPIYSPLIRKLATDTRQQTADTNGQQGTHSNRTRPSASNQQTSAGVTHQRRRNLDFSTRNAAVAASVPERPQQSGPTANSNLTFVTVITPILPANGTEISTVFDDSSEIISTEDVHSASGRNRST